MSTQDAANSADLQNGIDSSVINRIEVHRQAD